MYLRYQNYILAIIFLIINWLYLTHNHLPLYADEAQYWAWAQHLAFGYFSKPPVIAWQIFASTSFCGNEEHCIRIGSSVMHAISSLLIYYFAKKLADNKTAFLCQLTYLTLPAVIVSSSIASTDAPLITFWMLCCLFIYQALKTRKLGYFILFGISFGFGMLTKFNMALILVCLGVYLLWAKQLSKELIFKFTLSCLIAFIIYSPNLMWNFANSFVSYKHTGAISQLDESGLKPLNAIIFFFGQAAVFGPILFGYLGYILYKRPKFDDAQKYLISFSLPFICLFIILSTIGKSNVNWAAPAYSILVIFVIMYAMMNKNYIVVKASLTLHLIIIAGFYNYGAIAKIAEQNNFNIPDPFVRMKGWPEAAIEVNDLAKQLQVKNIISDERKFVATNIYYLRNINNNIYKFNPSTEISDHFDISNNIKNMQGSDFIFTSQYYGHSDQLKKYFGSVKVLTPITIRQNNNHNIILHLYLLRDFHGY